VRVPTANTIGETWGENILAHIDLKSKQENVVKAFTIVLLIILLSGCAGPQAITNATARDTIFSTETRANGATVMWLTHDDVGTYCTVDKSLGELGYEIMKSGRDALITYRTLNAADKENGALFGLFQGGCNTDNGSGNNTNYLVTGIKYADPITETLK
jgi:hypothetical protein